MQLRPTSGGGMAALRTRNSSKKLMGFGKAWTVGDKLTVFFPVMFVPELDNYGDFIMTQKINSKGNPEFNAETGEPVMVKKGYWDIVAASEWGHSISDVKEFGAKTIFLPSLTDIYKGRPVVFHRDSSGEIEYDDYGEPIYDSSPGDVSYQFSKIAPLFIAGDKQAELNKAESQDYASDAFRYAATSKIVDKYDTTKSFDAPRPIIGKLQLMITTEVLAVRHLPGDGFDTQHAALYTYTLSDEKLNQLFALLSNPRFMPENQDARWFEVEMTFTANSNSMQDRGVASRAAQPVGLSPEYTMKSRNPVAYGEIETKLKQLPVDSSMVKSRNTIYTRIPEKKILRCIENYVHMKSDSLDNLSTDEDVDKLLSFAPVLYRFGVHNKMNNDALKGMLDTAYAEYLQNNPHESEQLVSEKEGYSEPSKELAPSVKDLLLSADSASLPDSGDSYMNDSATTIL